MNFNSTHLAMKVLRAHHSHPPALVVNSFVNISVEAAYSVQHELSKSRLERGDIQIGYKVGCTSKRIQAQVGIYHPIFGRLFLQDKRESPQTIDRADFDGLAIEAELAVHLACDPRELSDSRSELKQSINHIFPVIELHHAGDPTAHLNASILVANNAMHAGFVQSSTRQVTRATKPQSMSIYLDRRCISTVPIEELEHTIFDSLMWLRRELRSIDNGPRLKPPVTVLCGSVAKLFRVEEPVDIRVEFGEHSAVHCNVR